MQFGSSSTAAVGCLRIALAAIHTARALARKTRLDAYEPQPLDPGIDAARPVIIDLDTTLVRGRSETSPCIWPQSSVSKRRLGSV
jgi:hypothetical protein